MTIDGEPYVVKHLDHDADWTLRVAGIPGSATVELWRRGVFDELPDCFNQPIVAVAHDVRRPTVSALLMHDVGTWLVPATDDTVPVEQHERFLDHMAALHATFWERRIDVVSPTDRYLELSPRMAAAEAAIGSDHLVPRLVAQGWPLLEEVAPALARVVVPLVHEPAPLVDALDRTPATFVHGNWKLDNLGTDDPGVPCCSTGSCPARARRPATSRGTSRSTAAGSPRRRSRRSCPTARRSSATASRPSRGGTASSVSA